MNTEMGNPAARPPEIPTTAPTATLTTLSRGLAVLEYVAHAKHLVRLRDVAEHFQIDRSSALRFLRTLEVAGYIVRHEAMKVYSLGPKLLSFPRLPGDVERIIQAARPMLETLSRTTGQIAHLATLNGLDAVLVEVVTSDAPVSVKQAVGDLEPLYASAVGKVVYAFAPQAQRQALGQQINFKKLTRRTLPDTVALDAEASQIRSTGVAFDRQEGNEHVACIACPILKEDGTALASIGLSYVSAHLDKPIDAMHEHISLLRQTARAIESSLLQRR